MVRSGLTLKIKPVGCPDALKAGVRERCPGWLKVNGLKIN